MKKTFFLRLSMLILVSLSVFSVNVFAEKTHAVINEVLKTNTTNLLDDNGNRSAWIEIYNPTHRVIDLGGLYLTNDSLNSTKYLIPAGDEVTLIQPLSHIVFFADNNTSLGIFHTNFTLNETNYLALYDADTITRLDAVLYPVDMKENVSYGRLVDGGLEWGILGKVSANNNNALVLNGEASKAFAEKDPYGIVLSLISMSIVFLALVLLYTSFTLSAKLSLYVTRDRIRKTTNKEIVEENIPGEVYACIAMALHQHQQEVHDVEDTILTIQRVAKSYSPWSSKIYGLRNYTK